MKFYPIFLLIFIALLPIYGNSLVAYWNFNETTGNTVYDSTGNNNGTLVNMDGANRVAGVYGNALDFDGTQEYVDCGAHTSLNFSTNRKISVFAWVYARDGVTDYQGVVSQFSTSGNWVFQLGTGTTDNVWRVRLWTGPGYAENGINYNFGTINLNEWNFIGFTYDGSYVNTYQNGTLQTSTNREMDFPTVQYTTYLGLYMVSQLQSFNGLIDEVSIWNQALNGEEIFSLMNTNAIPETSTHLLIFMGVILFFAALKIR